MLMKSLGVSKMPLKDLKELVSEKNLIGRYFILILCLFVSAAVFNIFLLPTNIVTGGTNGIAIILHNLFEFNPSTVIMIASLLMLMLSFIFLGVEKTIGSIAATIIYPIFVSLTAPLVVRFHVDSNELLLLSLLIGCISGVTNGLTYRVGFSSGGLSILNQILYKYFHISYSKSSFVVNGTIVFLGGIYFGFNMVMYAIIILYINSLVMDKVMLGVSKNKAFYIITKEDEKIKKFIIEELHHSVTVFDVKGGFLEKKRHVLLTVVPTREYFMVTEGIKLIDKDVFFVASDAYQTEGGS